jgi:hypothetical protein
MTEVRKRDLHDDENDLTYWLSKSVEERIQALEELRYRYMKFFTNESDRRLQRVYSVVKQEQR